MKKRITIILVVILLLVVVLTMCACKKNASADYVSGSKRFVLIESGNTFAGAWEILCDSETRVMYLFVKEGYGGGLTVMLDENGNPLLYKGELD